MNKKALAGLLFFLFGGVSWAGPVLGHEKWYYRHIETAQTSVAITTGAGIFGGISVDSATPSSWMYVFDTSQVGAMAASTIAAFNLGDINSGGNYRPISISSGLFINITGTPKITIFFDDYNQ